MRLLTLAALLLLGACARTPSGAGTYTVGDDWPTPGGDAGKSHHSPLTDMTPQNVGTLGLAWAFVAHTDSRFEPETLCRFVRAYQHVQPLTIGELWAVAITLRIVLIENLRRLSDQITAGREARADADVHLGWPGRRRSAWPAGAHQRTRTGPRRP